MNHTHHNTNTMTSSLRATVLTGAVLLVSFAGPSALQAAVVASYESGITAAGGVSGAADPTGQGWTLSNGDGSNPYAAGFDSGDGGWRTVDGTAMIEAHYTQSLTSGNWTALDSADNWTLSWTIAMDVDAISSSGGNVGDYYIDGGSSRQTSITTMVDRDDEFRYWISHAIGASNELLLKDEGSGTTYATGVIVDSGFPNFSTFSMTYDNATGDMELDYGAGTAILTSASADPNTDRLMMGSESVSGQGSAIWNSMSMETYSAPVPRPSVIPEPSTMALLLTGSVLFAAGRARHRA